MASISLVINCDTRKGQDTEVTRIGDYGSGSLQGCRSWDFLTDGIRNKMNFFRGYDLQTIVYVDEHEKLKPEIVEEIHAIGNIKLVVDYKTRFCGSKFNDWLYVNALKHAECGWVCHADQDVAAFRRDDCRIVDDYTAWLGKDYKYICQPSVLTKEQHQMSHASTRWLFCNRETLDFTEMERCLTDSRYCQRRFPGKHIPCLEFLLSAISGPDSVLYPPANDWRDYMVFSWVSYFRENLAKLNQMSYEQVRKQVLEWGLHGPSDCISTLLP